MMWGVLLGLLLISTATAGDVTNATSESSEEVKKADNVDNPLNESRRFSSDDISVNTQVRSLQISTPPRNYAQISSPDPSLYHSPLSSPLLNGQANNMPPRNILQKPSVFYPPVPNLHVQTIKAQNIHSSPLSSPLINGQANNVPPRNIQQDPNLHYSPLLSPQINGQANNMPPSNIRPEHSHMYPPTLDLPSLPGQNTNQKFELQNILNQPGSTQEVSCSGHTEVLYRVWLILRTLLESGSTSPYINQIKEALMYLTNYLNELNPGKLNKEFIISLEKQLEQKSVNFQLPTWPLDTPFHPNVNVPPSNLGVRVERKENLSPKCKKSLLKLIELTQATFDYILKSSDCQENHIDRPSDSNPYQLPYYDQNVHNTGTNYFNHLLGINPSGVLNQKPIGNPDLNNLLSSELHPSLVATQNQMQRSPLNGFMNSNFVDVQSSPYSHSYSIHSSMKSDSQLKNPEISLPTHVMPWHNFQNQQPPSSIPVTKENLLSPQVPNKGGFLNGYNNYVQNHLGGRTFSNNGQQQINLNTHSGSFPMSPNSSPIDQQTLWATLQNMSSNPAYRQNIQKYISSQTVQQHNYQVPPQSGPYVNVNPSVNHYIPPQTHVGNHGFDSNVQSGSLPSQHYGSYHQSHTQSTPYTSGNPTGHVLHVLNQNSYQGIGSARTGTSTIDWNNIVNGSNLSQNYTPNGEVELTFVIRRTDQNQPLYVFKYRISYDVFIQNVRGLLGRRSGDTDIAKGLVTSSNASEVPKELANLSQEELKQMVLEEGVLTKARYIDDSDNDTSSSAANSINELFNESINKNADDITAGDDFTRS